MIINRLSVICPRQLFGRYQVAVATLPGSQVGGKGGTLGRLEAPRGRR